MAEIEKMMLEHEDVKSEIAKLELPGAAVIICDPWTYGLLILQLASLNKVLNILQDQMVSWMIIACFNATCTCEIP